MGVRAETMKSKHAQGKRALSKILSTEVPKDQQRMELHLMPHMRHGMTTRQQQRL